MKARFPRHSVILCACLNLAAVSVHSGLLPKDQVKDPVDDVLNGIAWDAQNRRLFVTGKNWPSLFEIRLTGPR